MRTISVREAAAALGITPRAVTYRLEKGQLKGVLNKNEFGVPEWRIYPNKEISKGLASADSGDINFEPSNVVDAEPIESNDPVRDVETGSDQGATAGDFRSIVEQCVRPLVEEVKAQAIALAEKDKIIEEQRSQLLLLPDLESQKAQLLNRIEAERKAAEIQAAKVADKEREAADLISENEKLRLEAEDAKSKAEEAALSREKLKVLEQQMEQLRMPWWKKWLSSPNQGGEIE